MEENSRKPIYVYGRLWAMYDTDYKAVFMLVKSFGIPLTVYCEIYRQVSEIEAGA